MRRISRINVFLILITTVRGRWRTHMGYVLGLHKRVLMVNVMSDNIGDRLVGLYLLPDRLTGADCLKFLKQMLPEFLTKVHVSTTTHPPLWYQQDAGCQFRFSVRNQLSATFCKRRIGRVGPVNWPAWSSDLSCIVYFFWGHVEFLFYETPVDSAEDLVARTVTTTGEIEHTPGMFAAV